MSTYAPLQRQSHMVSPVRVSTPVTSDHAFAPNPASPEPQGQLTHQTHFAHDFTHIPAYSSASSSSPQAEPAQPRKNTTGLPDTLKAGVENLSGLSMDDVHVHYNSGKPAQVNARAYTQGTEIHVGPGQEEHLPHEAWHVVQQKQGRVQATLQAKGVDINDDVGLEKEADVMGGKAKGLQSEEETSETRSIGKKREVTRKKVHSLQDAPIQGYFVGRDSKRVNNYVLDAVRMYIESTGDMMLGSDFDDTTRNQQEPTLLENWLASNGLPPLETFLQRSLALEQGIESRTDVEESLKGIGGSPSLTRRRGIGLSPIPYKQPIDSSRPLKKERRKDTQRVKIGKWFITVDDEGNIDSTAFKDQVKLEIQFGHIRNIQGYLDIAVKALKKESDTNRQKALTQTIAFLKEQLGIKEESSQEKELREQMELEEIREELSNEKAEAAENERLARSLPRAETLEEAINKALQSRAREDIDRALAVAFDTERKVYTVGFSGGEYTKIWIRMGNVIFFTGSHPKLAPLLDILNKVNKKEGYREVWVCAEVDAVAKALIAGSSIFNLKCVTVKKQDKKGRGGSGEEWTYLTPCLNCAQWVDDI